MCWTTYLDEDCNLDEIQLGILDLTLGNHSGQGEIAPASFYSTFQATGDDPDDWRRQLVHEGYSRLLEWTRQYVDAAAAAGYVLPMGQK